MSTLGRSTLTGDKSHLPSESCMDEQKNRHRQRPKPYVVPLDPSGRTGISMPTKGLEGDVRHSPVEPLNTEFRLTYNSGGGNRLRLIIVDFDLTSFGLFATSP